MSLMAEFRYAVVSASDRAMDLAMPTTCAGCYDAGTILCRECRAAMKTSFEARTRARSGIEAAIPAPLRQLEWCGSFSGITRRVLDRLRDDGERRLSEPLGGAIAERWFAVGAGGDVLVPVPGSADLTKARGFDEALLLARVAGRQLRMPVVQALARSTRAAPDRGGAFEVIAAGQIRDRSIVLIDDVVATGATLVACAAALLRVGARAVSAVTVANARPPAPPLTISFPAA